MSERHGRGNRNPTPILHLDSSWLRRGLIVLTTIVLTIAAPGGRTDPFIGSVTENSRFYRLVASYMHGDERVDFDIVVGCSVLVTDYRDNDPSYDAFRDPLIFAKPTKDGGAVMQIVSDACRGETTDNGDVPPDFLPGVVWFDDKNDLSFGTGYISEDAFANPASKLKFIGASIHPASKRDWLAFRSTAAKDNIASSRIYVNGSSVEKPTPSEISANLWNVAQLKKWRPWLVCHGIARVELTDPAQRDALAKFWPSQHPKYWKLGSDLAAQQHMLQQVAAASGKRTIVVGDQKLSRFVFGYTQSGFPTRAGGGTFRSGKPWSEIPAQIFPVQSELALKWLDRRVGSAAEIDFNVDEGGGKNLGFVYCYSTLANGEPLGDAHLPGFLSRKFTTRVDGTPVDTGDGTDSAASGNALASFFREARYYYFSRIMFSFQ